MPFFFMSETVVISLVGASVVALALFALGSWSNKADDDENSSSSCSSRSPPRNVSFTSMGLALGSFPTKAEVPDATINTACYFDKEAPSAQALATQVVEPLLAYERFSHVLNLDKHSFEPCVTKLEPSKFIREIVIRGNEQLTHQTIFEHLQDDLKNRHGADDLPWWEILVIRNHGPGSSACVIRVHHALADGLALVHAFDDILVDMDGNPLSVTKNLYKAATSKKNILAQCWSLLEATLHVLLLGASKYDDDTVFSKCNHAKMKHNGKRDFVLFPVVPLSFIKNLKTAAQCTVNDILVTAISQAIHDYCVNQQDPLLVENKNAHKIQCRALLPVGFPRKDTELADPHTAMRNKWCMASCDVGVGLDKIMDRLAHVHGKTKELKSKPRALVQLYLQNNIAAHLPTSVAQQTVMDVFSRHSLVLTNVPGPSEMCQLAGQPVQAVQVFFTNLLTQVDLLSYNGQVYGNIIYDDTALPNFQDFGLYYARALVHLAQGLEVTVPPDLQKYET